VHSKYDNLTIAGGHAMLAIPAAGTGKLVEEIVRQEDFNISRHLMWSDLADFRIQLSGLFVKRRLVVTGRRITLKG
jgi:hypothetical protein